MSLEAALDDERREVMDLLEGRTSQSRSQDNRSNSPLPFSRGSRRKSPVPPVRSMLDIGGSTPAKHGSAAGQSAGVANTGVRSMLDLGKQGTSRNAQTAPTSPDMLNPSGSGLHRARSDASEFRPRALNDREGVDLNTDYQFSMLPSIQNQALPKRVTQGGKKQNLGSMAAIMQGQELGPLSRGRDQGRHNSAAGIGSSSKSPSSRLFNRSESPGGSHLQMPGKFVTETGKVIDMNTAYRKLSDAALLNSGGGLSMLPSTTASNQLALNRGETLSPAGEVRLQKDYYQNKGDGEGGVESSEEEPQTGSSGDEGWGQRSVRGRKRGRRTTGSKEGCFEGEDSENDGRDVEGSAGLGNAPGPRKVQSLLAAAEEERKSSHP